MNPSSTLCRAQEALQRSRAAGTSLENVRTIAEKAAAAWCIEAVFAEKREQRREQTQQMAATLLDGEDRTRDQDDSWFNENPDRGRVNA